MSKTTNLADTLNELDAALVDFQSKLQKFTSVNPSLDLLTSSHPAEHVARTHLTLSFALNSLYFSCLRLSQTDKPAEVKAHPVHSQLKIIREHYVKLDNVVNRRGGPNKVGGN